MSVEKILSSWKKNTFKPVYWLEGEEDFYIDQVVNYAEHHILSEADASFNLTVFYGKDADWAQIINACRRYPMFAEKQVVILKEAQHMKDKDLEELGSYIENAMATTVFVVAYKSKGVDKRKKLYKIIQANAEVLVTQKMKEGKVQEWIMELVQSKGLTIKPKSAALLEEHIGNDLSRISNEIDKLLVNLQQKKTIDEDDIEKYIGISKEYNVFELQAAIIKKDLAAALKIIQYFDANPKAAPIQMVLPALYAYFSKVYIATTMQDQSDNALKPLFYFNPIALGQGKLAMKNYGYAGVEKIILLLHHYNLKSLGVDDGGNTGAQLMKELIVKIMLPN
ncbi:DNA polymerase III subunit delta [Ferruginibacter yonginensis]|uniref:DNA polymerase III subunit delta n=1 Tax=Ferruginibacter yonginensis TaxID=1310416 RepID=A0ABV8QQU9_9BACT